MDKGSKQAKSRRIRKVALIAAFLLVIGVIYALAFHHTEIGISCVIRRFTGYKCPGCGMTHAVSSLMDFDIVSAFRQNALFPFIIAYIIAVVYHAAKTYINSGHTEVGSGSEKLDIAFLVVLLIWWPLRNILSI